jgi:hypothetical protein
VNLAFDKAGDLLVLSSSEPESTVYSFRPGSPKDQIAVLVPQETKPHSGARAVLPVNYWNNGEFRTQLDFSAFRRLPRTAEHLAGRRHSASQSERYWS